MKDEKVIQDSQDKVDGFFQDDVRDLSDDELDAIAGGISKKELNKLIEDRRALRFRPPFS